MGIIARVFQYIINATGVLAAIIIFVDMTTKIGISDVITYAIGTLICVGMLTFRVREE